MRKPKHSHSNRDIIYTPEVTAKKCIDKIPFLDGDSWCDPCYGQGVFYNNFPSDNKEYYEIEMGKDFFDCNKKYDWVVTNIPFSMPKEFINKMSDTCIKGFGILCLSNSMTVMRLKALEDKGLYLNSTLFLYIKDWGFGYRTEFMVFTREKNLCFDYSIVERQAQQDVAQKV